ncbi:MAG: sigma 54-interacting transcriptional regulator [Desulfocapsaceae bacterium]|nr:sigma 54-interacting transcriptional regulator [Desulfocapsaceae bacterium]
MKQENIARILKKSILFQQLEQSQLQKAAAIGRVVTFREGSYIYRQNDPGEGFYVVAAGDVALVLSQEKGRECVVSRIGPGGHFGETSLITGKPHSLGAKASCDLILVCFNRRVFYEDLLGDELIRERMNVALAERLRVSLREQGDTSGHKGGSAGTFNAVDEHALFEGALTDDTGEKSLGASRISTTAKRTQSITGLFAKNLDPVFLNGESGTGKKFLAKQIHLQGVYAHGPYIEIDLRDLEEDVMAEKLFGNQQDAFPFTHARQLGIFEQFGRGTVVLLNVEFLSLPLQQKLLKAIDAGSFTRIGGSRQIPFQCRVIFVSEEATENLIASDTLLPRMIEVLQRQHYRVPPIREHRRDLPRLIEHYLRRYSREFGKNIHKISPNSMGILLNYDWPGNLTELGSVIQRAVMLAQKNEILTDQILLGLPKTEGKWEFNILRIPWVKGILQSKVFPAFPRAVVGCIFLAAVLALFFGPKNPEKNIGITLSWIIGWPLLYFSFFFLARLWCSVCTLAVPGRIAQSIVKPERNTPEFIKKYSGWIMASLCILVLWVEIVFDAYNTPFIGGWVIVAVTLGSFIFSIIFKRRVWCRYVCPLGAINAIFAMPSVLELRANRHLCLNRCRQHVCFGTENEQEGCPMFRHPFLVDNNRDCILCAKCIKSCKENSIHLNLRLAPQELWSLETPRRPDSFLIVALGAIFFPFALQGNFFKMVGRGVGYLHPGFDIPIAVSATLVFFGLILLFEIGYGVMVAIQARYTAVNKDVLLPLLGYGFIPLILGCYLGVHFELFVSGAWRIWPNFLDLMGLEPVYQARRILSPDTTAVLQAITVLGGMLASFYAIFRIMARLKGSRKFSWKMLALPYSFMIVLGGLSLSII